MDEIIIDGVDVSGCEYCLNNKLKGKGHSPAKVMPYAKETSCIACKAKNTQYNFCKHNPNCYYKQLRRAEQELQKFQDMAKKGLEEFKDVGGCWGCGLQLQLNQDFKDIKQLKAENERLKAQLDVLEEDNKKLSSENDALYNNSLQEVKEDLVKRVWNLQTENKELAHYLACMTEQRNRANTCLQEIKTIATSAFAVCDDDCGNANRFTDILDLITKAEEE